jgi:RHS repeat-associated protein
MQGAGGIGGILATNGNEYSYDGNGNVRDIISASGINIAHYEYDPFGNKTLSSGSYSSQPYQWSSKEFHAPSGMVYYLYRFYSPQLGRWINRDPIEEAGGINLYGFVGNNGVSGIDPLGLHFQPPVTTIPNMSPKLPDLDSLGWNPWRTTNHVITLIFTAENDLKSILGSMYSDLKLFIHFSPNRGGSVSVSGNHVNFSAPGILKIAQTVVGTVPFSGMTIYNGVTLSFDDAAHMVKGKTDPGHILEGYRNWKADAELSTCEIKIKTWATERSSNFITEGIRKIDVNFGPDLQDAVWHDYLTNIGVYWQSKGAKASNVTRGRN